MHSFVSVLIHKVSATNRIFQHTIPSHHPSHHEISLHLRRLLRCRCWCIGLPNLSAWPPRRPTSGTVRNVISDRPSAQFYWKGRLCNGRVGPRIRSADRPGRRACHRRSTGLWAPSQPGYFRGEPRDVRSSVPCSVVFGHSAGIRWRLRRGRANLNAGRRGRPPPVISAHG